MPISLMFFRVQRMATWFTDPGVTAWETSNDAGVENPSNSGLVAPSYMYGTWMPLTNTFVLPSVAANQR